MTQTSPPTIAQLINARVHGVGEALRKYHTLKPGFRVDPLGTDLVSIVEAAIAYARRAADLFDACQATLNKASVVPCAILARAFMETVAMGFFLISELEKAVDKRNMEKIDKIIKGHYVGARHPAFSEKKGPHVLDALRALHDANETYMTSVLQKYQLPDLEKPPEGWPTGLMDCYETLSEFAHPNYGGSHGVYPLLELEGEEIDEKDLQPARTVREQLQNMARAAIVQALSSGHHLLKVLEHDSFEALAGKYVSLAKSPKST